MRNRSASFMCGQSFTFNVIVSSTFFDFEVFPARFADDLLLFCFRSIVPRAAYSARYLKCTHRSVSVTSYSLPSSMLPFFSSHMGATMPTLDWPNLTSRLTKFILFVIVFLFLFSLTYKCCGFLCLFAPEVFGWTSNDIRFNSFSNGSLVVYFVIADVMQYSTFHVVVCQGFIIMNIVSHF